MSIILQEQQHRDIYNEQVVTNTSRLIQLPCHRVCF